jgi:hypothetical protein
MMTLDDRRLDRLIEIQERSLNCLIAIELRLKTLDGLLDVANWWSGFGERVNHARRKIARSRRKKVKRKP